MSRDLIDRTILLSGDVYYNDSKTLIPTYEVARDKSVDAVEVVRCKDCLEWEPDPDTYGLSDGPKGICRGILDSMGKTSCDDYCSLGERRVDS